MKTILAVLRGPEDAERVLERAIFLAGQFGSHVIGFHCEALPGTYTTPMTFPTAEFYETDRNAATQRTAQIQEIFEEQLRDSGVSGEFRATETFTGDSAVSALSSAYASDLVIAGQVDPDTIRADIADLDRLLFDSGRPVIIVPYAATKPKAAIERIVIGWDGSRESARAAFDALPLILKASSTEILTVDAHEADDRAGPLAGVEIAKALARHGAKVSLETQPSGGLDIGVVIQNRLFDTGADLLVIGAYRHSRLRQFLFGGVTRTLLTSMPTMTLLSR